MKKFYVYKNPAEGLVEKKYCFVNSGVSILAFIFYIFWLLSKKMWGYAALFLFLMLCSYLGVELGIIREIHSVVVLLVAKLMLAFEASFLIGRQLENKGYELCFVVYGKSLPEARIKFFEMGGYDES